MFVLVHHRDCNMVNVLTHSISDLNSFTYKLTPFICETDRPEICNTKQKYLWKYKVSCHITMICLILA